MKRQSKRAKGKVVPLLVVDGFISYDTLSTIERLEELTVSGDCLGIAFAAILKGGQFAHGYTGAAVEQPELAAGLLSKVIYHLHRNAEEGWSCE